MELGEEASIRVIATCAALMFSQHRKQAFLSQKTSCADLIRGARLSLRVGYVSRTTMQAPRRLAYVVHANRANMPRAVGGFLQAPTPLSVIVFTEGIVTWILLVTILIIIHPTCMYHPTCMNLYTHE